MNIIDYMILRQSDVTYMGKQVEEYISKGWQPWGGLLLERVECDKDVYCQAMVRYEK